MSATQNNIQNIQKYSEKSIQVVVLEPNKIDKGSHKFTHFSLPNPSSNTIFWITILKVYSRAAPRLRVHRLLAFNPFSWLIMVWRIPDRCWCQGTNLAPLMCSGITCKHLTDLNWANLVLDTFQHFLSAHLRNKKSERETCQLVHRKKSEKAQKHFQMKNKKPHGLWHSWKNYTVLWRHDYLNLLGWKVCAWIMQFCILIIFHNVIMVQWCNFM